MRILFCKFLIKLITVSLYKLNSLYMSVILHSASKYGSNFSKSL